MWNVQLDSRVQEAAATFLLRPVRKQPQPEQSPERPPQQPAQSMAMFYAVYKLCVICLVEAARIFHRALAARRQQELHRALLHSSKQNHSEAFTTSSEASVVAARARLGFKASGSGPQRMPSKVVFIHSIQVETHHQSSSSQNNVAASTTAVICSTTNIRKRFVNSPGNMIYSLSRRNSSSSSSSSSQRSHTKRFPKRKPPLQTIFEEPMES